MQIIVAISVSFLLFIFYYFIIYYLCDVKFFSSVTFAIFLSFIFLNILYPISETVNEEISNILLFYFFIQIFSVFIIITYLIYNLISDIKIKEKPIQTNTEIDF